MEERGDKAAREERDRIGLLLYGIPAPLGSSEHVLIGGLYLLLMIVMMV